MIKAEYMFPNGEAVLVSTAAMGKTQIFPVWPKFDLDLRTPSHWCGEQSESYVAEAATDYESPCCEGHGIYAHFLVRPNGTETLCGFQCTCCGTDYDVSEKEDFGL